MIKHTSSHYRLFPIGKVILPVALFLCAVNAHAQQAPPKRDIPTGPLLQKVSGFAKWVITFSYPSDRQKAGTGAPSSPSAPPAPADPSSTRTVTTTKTKDIIHQETVALNGNHMEKWCLGTTQYWKNPGSDQWLELPVSNANSGDNLAASSGFDDLSWIGSKTYVSTITYGQHTCFVFMQEGMATNDLYNADTLTKKLPTLTDLALIDATTRLPVEVRNGDVYQLYQFEAPPTEMQPVAPDLLASFKKADEVRKQLDQRAPRPF